ncbi:hypothetical protein JW905_02320 [bacterium]|nr:hypothetical protein [candidate division CSSED10-310 bacterium]
MITPMRLLNAALVLVVTLLGLSIANLSSPPNEIALSAAVTAPESRSRSTGLENWRYELPSRNALKLIMQKNLFHPERMMTKDEQDGEEPDEPEIEEAPPGMVLVGTIITGDRRVALISEPSIKKGSTVQYEENDEILDFNIKSITAQKVVFSGQDDKEIVLPLRRGERKQTRRPTRSATQRKAATERTPGTPEQTERSKVTRRIPKSTGGSNSKLPFPLPGRR